ncbi:hypothetical protein AB0D12_36120 [Streptomyces sp. NPDC048479]|uniref:hypothetical protein n=1 Tax=Streptomyces sp. NPDC048479 TaxID=3154725 RepID=UPI0034367870
MRISRWVMWAPGWTTAGLDKPLLDGGGDVAACGVDAAGKVRCVEAAGGSGAVRAFLGVVGALDDVSAAAG